jgi:hypothetical protein
VTVAEIVFTVGITLRKTISPRLLLGLTDFCGATYTRLSAVGARPPKRAATVVAFALIASKTLDLAKFAAGG